MVGVTPISQLYEFASLEEVESRILAFQPYYETIATPFEWRFTHDDLLRLIARWHQGEHDASANAA